MATQRLLVESGVVPDNCQNVELHISPARAMILRYDVLVTPDMVEKLALVFHQMASESKPKQDAQP